MALGQSQKEPRTAACQSSFPFPKLSRGVLGAMTVSCHLCIAPPPLCWHPVGIGHTSGGRLRKPPFSGAEVAVAAAAGGNGVVSCSPLSGPGELHPGQEWFHHRHAPCQAVSSSLHALTPHPASFFLLNPLIKLGWALPCLKPPRQGRPADKWVIGEGQLRCPGPQRVTPGWLAAHPSTSSSPEPGQQETAAPSPQPREWPPGRQRESELC